MFCLLRCDLRGALKASRVAGIISKPCLNASPWMHPFGASIGRLGRVMQQISCPLLFPMPRLSRILLCEYIYSGLVNMVQLLADLSLRMLPPLFAYADPSFQGQGSVRT
ncbi:hypothetical protein LMG33818_000309 [Halomonadaceae bacterium LMG 33818]